MKSLISQYRIFWWSKVWINHRRKLGIEIQFWIGCAITYITNWCLLHQNALILSRIMQYSISILFIVQFSWSHYQCTCFRCYNPGHACSSCYWSNCISEARASHQHQDKHCLQVQSGKCALKVRKILLFIRY